MFYIKHLYLILVLFNFSQSSIIYVTRETVSGKIRGFVTKRTANIHVEQYLGIPYALPPIEDLRFEFPKLPNSWNSTLDTLNIPPACPQKNWYYVQKHVPGFSKTSEDCLYLNLYVPQVYKNKTLPVLFYVHGGANALGMGAMFDGDILAAHGQIIVVTFNYRLGVLGFAAAKEEGLEGTYGFLDQIKAMEWVKNNIEFFGGNPDSVTIHGHSAGGFDVGLHLISPLSKGFFTQAIIHSGSPLMAIAMIKPDWKPGYNIEMENVGKLCPKSSQRSTLKSCLKSSPLIDVVRVREKKRIRGIVHTFPSVVDGTFLKARPEDLFAAGNVSGKSFLVSFTSAEWAESVYHEKLRYSMSLVDKELQHIISTYPVQCSEKDRILQQYNLTNDNEDSSTIMHRLIEIESDFLFVAPLIQMSDLMSVWKKDLFVSLFDQPILWDSLPADIGPAHGEDLFYIFGTPFVGHKNYNFSEKDKDISIIMMRLYSNFVKYGFLTLDGKTKYSQYTSSSKIVNSLSFDNKGIVIEEIHNYKVKKMRLWNEVLPNMTAETEISFCNSGSDCSVSEMIKTFSNIFMILYFLAAFF